MCHRFLRENCNTDVTIHLSISLSLFLLWRCDPTWVKASSFLKFLVHTQRRTTVGRTPLDEWSACRRDLYRTAHNTHNKKHPCPGGIRNHDLSRRAAAPFSTRLVKSSIKVFHLLYSSNGCVRLFFSIIRSFIRKIILDISRSSARTKISHKEELL
jgi:hypothetical protein